MPGQNILSGRSFGGGCCQIICHFINYYCEHETGSEICDIRAKSITYIYITSVENTERKFVLAKINW